MGAIKLACTSFPSDGIVSLHPVWVKHLSGDNHHFAAWVFTGALSVHFWVIAQLNVYNAPLAGGHRLQRLATTSLDHLVRHRAG